jgi:proteasome activator subunit 4
MLAKHDWSTLARVWPAVVTSRHSEKPSVAKLIDTVLRTLHGYADTFTMEIKVSNAAIEKAKVILDSVQACPSDDEIAQFAHKTEEKNRINIATYDSLVDRLCHELEGGHEKKLHWRHYNLAVGMLSILTRQDRWLPQRAVKLIVENLNHENLLVRKCSIHIMGCIMKQHKRPHIKIPKTGLEENTAAQVPGDRAGNEWMCFSPEKVPKSSQDWDKPTFVHKTHYGYYTWPQNMSVYAPSDQQPPVRRPLEDLSPQEQEVFKFFSNEDKVAKLIGFLALEEHKGADRFNARRFAMFKGLFRNYGDEFLPLLKPHLDRLCDQDQESAHRCAAEIIAALIRGTKHWPYDMANSLWEWLQPLLRKIIGKITVESIGDWGTCFATASESRDPNKMHWLLEVLMEEPIQSKGAFTDCSRLYALQGALAQQEWRIPPIMHDLLKVLKPFLTHSLLNVRERMGSMLTNIFVSDVDFTDFHPGSLRQKSAAGGNQRNPKVAEFILEVLPSLEILAFDDDNSVTENGDKRPNNGVSGVPQGISAISGPRFPPPFHPGMMGGPGPGPRMMMPQPEMMARLRGMVPGPRGPGAPPDLRAMLAQCPPEMMARMRLPPPEMMARMPMMPPDMMAMMTGHPPTIPNGLMDSTDNVDPAKEEKQKAMRLLQTGTCSKIHYITV